jgi:hypothetical protein
MARIKFVLNERRIALEEARFRAMQREEGVEDLDQQLLAAGQPDVVAGGGIFEEPAPATPPRL